MNIKELRERHGREGSWEKSPEWGCVVLDGAGRRRDLKIAFPSFFLHFPEPQSKSHRTRAPKGNGKQSSYLEDRCLVIYAHLQKTFSFSLHLLFLLLHCFLFQILKQSVILTKTQLKKSSLFFSLLLFQNVKSIWNIYFGLNQSKHWF